MKEVGDRDDDKWLISESGSDVYYSVAAMVVKTGVDLHERREPLQTTFVFR
jgi:hypothetical protein